MLVSSNFFASAVSLFGHELARALLRRAGQVGDGEAARETERACRLTRPERAGSALCAPCKGALPAERGLLARVNTKTGEHRSPAFLRSETGYAVTSQV